MATEAPGRTCRDGPRGRQTASERGRLVSVESVGKLDMSLSPASHRQERINSEAAGLASIGLSVTDEIIFVKLSSLPFLSSSPHSTNTTCK